jgi:hypothetical protein
LAADQAAAANAGAASPPSSLSPEQQALLQMSLADKIQTTGANGATELLANQLAAAAQLLLQQGKIDQAQYNILMELANQGHRMAQIQSLLDSGLKAANGDVAAFASTTYVLDGKTYTSGDLASLIGFTTYIPDSFYTGSPLDIAPTDPNVQQESGKLLSLYNQALTSGALSDPAALATVNSAVAQIADLGELTENTVQTGIHTTGAVLTANTLSNLDQSTHMTSAEICVAGDFQDNGVLCSN